MRSRKLGIYIMTVLLILAACFFGIQESARTAPFSFFAVTEAGTEKIHYWQNPEGQAYVFLPGHVNLSQIHLVNNSLRPLKFDELVLTHGSACEPLQLNKAYVLSGRSGIPETVTFVQSANVPAMYIDTASGSLDYILQSKENKEYAKMRLYTREGELNHAGNLEFIKTRGNNVDFLISIDFLKMPYSIKLMNQADLLGMGEASKWILLSNPFDVSHLRNKIVYDFARELGLAYSPECRWVDLYVNGNYAGLYLLCERNEIHPQRVNLSKEGSFLVSQELDFRLEEQGIPYIWTDRGDSLRIQESSMELWELEQIWRTAENAIWAVDGIDPETGKHWTELIDLDSWAKKYLIEEVFGNVDGGRVSQFYYYDGRESAGKIYAGPVWDYDTTMGNPRIASTVAPSLLFVNVPYEQWGSPWFNKLYQDPVFFQYMTELYEQKFKPLLKEVLEERIGQYVSEISAAARMNQLRWPCADLEGQAEIIRSYMTRRLDFFDELWLEDRDYSIVAADRMGRMFNYVVFKGEYLPELPYRENCVWYDAETNQPFDSSQPIFEDKRLYMKKEEPVT